MKILATALSLCLSLNVLASENLVNDLEQQLDSYKYSLTVEWDQKDQQFYTERTEAFFSSLSILYKQGLSNAHVEELLAKKSISPEALEIMESKLNALGASASPSDLVSVLNSDSEMYAQGASWNGTAIAFYGGVGIVFFGMIAYSTWFNANYECAEWELRRHNVCVRYEEK